MWGVCECAGGVSVEAVSVPRLAGARGNEEEVICNEEEEEEEEGTRRLKKV